MTFTVAIDGPAAAGKGTIARAVAAKFGFAHLDTGLLYRVVARRVLDGQDAIFAAQNLCAEDIADENALRTPGVAQAASKIAAMPDVRHALVAFQRAFAQRPGGAVLDGRDIGTVICPQAEVKLFVTANDTIRAHRRLNELQHRGHKTDFATVLANLKARDTRDAARHAAPMVAADDAIIMDTSVLSIDAAVTWAIDLIIGKRG